MIKLNNKLTLLVPIKDNNGEKINTELIQSELIKAAGGATTYKAEGHWVDEGKIYKDDNLAIQVNYTNDQREKVERVVNEQVCYLLTVGGQLSVSVESYNGLTIYDKADLPALKKQVIKAL